MGRQPAIRTIRTIRKQWVWATKLFLFGLLSSVCSSKTVVAQIIPDDTLGAEASRVRAVDNQREQIDGGAIRGGNLFHSFREFNIGEGRQADFANPDGVENIFSRVTGNNSSRLLGKLRVLGDANLFLLNPNGILFGPNAQIDVRGAFVATTADEIRFGNQGIFSAIAPTAPSLLTIQPSALFFNQARVAPITAQSNAIIGSDHSGNSTAGLQVQDGQNLLFAGGNISIDGGQLRAPDGSVELLSVGNAGLVNLKNTEDSFRLNVPANLALADIALTDRAFVSTSGESGGSVRLWGRQIVLSGGSQVEANTLGAGIGGGITVNASEQLRVIGEAPDTIRSGLFSEAIGAGSAGDLLINTAELQILNGAKISSGTTGVGQGGDLTVNASEQVLMRGETRNAEFGSDLFTTTDGTGDAGNLTVNTQRLSVLAGAQIGATTFERGNAGNLIVNATDFVRVVGATSDFSISGLFTQSQGSGDAGQLTINTRDLLVKDGAQISVSTFGSGQGGQLTVNVTETVRAIGETSDAAIASGLFNQVNVPLDSTTNAVATGDSADLIINTRRLLVRDGAAVSARTFSVGDGGRLIINATDSVRVVGISADGVYPSNLSTNTLGAGRAGSLRINTPWLQVLDGAAISAATTEDSIGNGGNIFINTRELELRDNAQIAVNSQGAGRGGNVNLRAGLLSLDKGSFISAETASSQGGDITLFIEDRLLMRNQSRISTTAGTAQAGGNGGNITLNTEFLLAAPTEDSNITANAFSGRGGNIQITAEGVFGIQFQPTESPLSDITASSEIGVDGFVELNTPDVDPSRGLVDFPVEVATPEVDQRCQPSDDNSTGQFVVTGRGGLPLSPSETISEQTIWEDIRPLQTQTENRSVAVNPTSEIAQPEPILIEAKGWKVDANGKVILITETPTATTNNSLQAMVECHTFQG